jgi:hypothetical protein
MADWEKLAQHYKADIDQKRRDQETKLELADKLKAGSRPLWDELARQLAIGAKAINANGTVLYLDFQESDKIEITYAPTAAKQIKYTVNFDPKNYAVRYATASRNWGEFKIGEDDDGKLMFMQQSTKFTAEDFAYSILLHVVQ